MTDPHLSEVISERRQLINLAYRLLGSLAEAEDVAQETYTRWYALSEQQREAIASPGAWMTTVASRICLDLLGSARARREHYVGDWIPEPVPRSRAAVTGVRTVMPARVVDAPPTPRTTPSFRLPMPPAPPTAHPRSDTMNQSSPPGPP